MESRPERQSDQAAPKEEQQLFRFLDLPPEMRNMIYKFALVEDKGSLIDITPDLKPPGLLSVCRQMREECLQIWYRQNTFIIQMYDCDASLKMAFEKHLARLGLNKLFLWQSVSGINWMNLMDW